MTPNSDTQDRQSLNPLMEGEQERRRRFFDECDASLAELQKDPMAWAHYQQELQSLECTLMEGLDPDEVWTEADGRGQLADDA